MTTLKERLAATIMIDPTSGLEAPINPDGAEALARIEALEAALLAVVGATRAYLPPDGISAQECLNRILAATDNPTITPIIREIEHGRA